jgi:RNA polymerase sigma-70 factor (ECF subfamily)
MRREEHALVEAARRGDEQAFRELVAPLRPQLYAHCRRMLRSSDDAEDALQETLLRAWRALSTFDGRAPIRAWLHRIAGNVCLTAIEKRPRHVVPIEDQDESASTDPDSETREAAAQAMTATLQLPANQRAALILRDVLGFRAREAASTLGTTPASVNSALVRARANLHAREPKADDERLRDAVEGFVAALARGDVDTLIGIAADTSLSYERSWSYSPVPVY